MIAFDKVQTYGWESALRGMRNPLNSWDKSDTMFTADGVAVVGEKDLDLMLRLAKGGTEHRKYLRMITVSMDVTAPRYWWTEADTYKIGMVKNSCSTMHTLHKRDLDYGDFSTDHITTGTGLECLRKTIEHINTLRDLYIKTKDKDYWYEMISLLPQSFNQTATLSFNYEVALSIIRQRKDHKLEEWHDFVGLLYELPYMGEIADALEIH